MGALVGIYGNWLIAFFERLSFPIEYNMIFWILLIWAIVCFVSFSTYLILAFKHIWYPSAIAGLHITLIFSIFVFQDAFVPLKKFPLSDNLTFWFLGVIIFLTIVGVEWITIRKHAFLLSWRWRTPRIGILHDMGWDLKNPEISAWTDIAPKVWAQQIKDSGLNAQFIKTTDNFDKFVAILNPYGSVYPEIDLRTLSTQKKILKFVYEGGIFLNISDIPTYYAYNAKLRRKVDTTKPILSVNENGQIVQRRLFQLTPLMRELGLSVLNVPETSQNLNKYGLTETSIFTERVAILESNIESFIPQTVFGKTNTSSFFDVPYGDGHFIFSLMFLSYSKHNQTAKNTIKVAIIRELVEKIKLSKELIHKS